jgi:molybdopterin synthase catalytic subunit
MTVYRLPASISFDEVIQRVSRENVGAVVRCAVGEEQLVVATSHRQEAWTVLKSFLTNGCVPMEAREEEPSLGLEKPQYWDRLPANGRTPMERSDHERGLEFQKSSQDDPVFEKECLLSGYGAQAPSQTGTESLQIPQVALLEEPVPPAYLKKAENAAVSFCGLVRKDRLSSDRVVSALVYESYREMAMLYMHRIAAEQNLHMFVHTVAGSVPVGSVSVLVTGPSVESVRLALEALKRYVPIWKEDVSVPCI